MECEAVTSKKKGKLKVAPESPCQKALWDDKTTEIFIRICVQAVKDGYRPTTHLNKLGYEKVMKQFRQETNRKYGKQQFKNRWDNLKRDWGYWKAMLKNETGCGWDHNKQTIDASDAWWRDKIKLIPECAKFREKGIPLPDQLRILFDKVYASGDSAWTPNSGVLPQHMIEDETDESASSHESAADLAEDSMTSIVASGTKKRKKDSENAAKQVVKKNSAAAGLRKSLDRIVEAVETSSATIASIRGGTQGTSISDVLQLLVKLPGVKEGDLLYMRACDLFLKPAYREMFVAHKSDETRLKWLQMQCTPPS